MSKMNLKPLQVLTSMILLLPIATACQRRHAPASQAPQVQATSALVDAETQVISSDRALDIQQLLAEASTAQKQKNFEKALELFRLAARAAQRDLVRRRALVGVAESLDSMGRFEESLTAYQDALAVAPSQRDLSLEVRVVRLLVYLERYTQAAQLSEQIPRHKRPALEQIALLVALGLAALADDQLQSAQSFFSDADALAVQRAYSQWASPPQDMAGLYFGQAELLRLESEAIELTVPLDQFPARVETRCQGLLAAQDQYSQVLRVGSAHWSAMAGVRVAGLYSQLHSELIAAAALSPAESEDDKALVEGALRLRYAVLLRKAVRLLETALSLVKRTAPDSAWQLKAEKALEELKSTKQAEEKTIDALPFTRAELQTMLDNLASPEEE